MSLAKLPRQWRKKVGGKDEGRTEIDRQTDGLVHGETEETEGGRETDTESDLHIEE